MLITVLAGVLGALAGVFVVGYNRLRTQDAAVDQAWQEVQSLRGNRGSKAEKAKARRAYDEAVRTLNKSAGSVPWRFCARAARVSKREPQDA